MTMRNRPYKHSGGYVAVTGKPLSFLDNNNTFFLSLGHGELRTGTEADVFAFCHELQSTTVVVSDSVFVLIVDGSLTRGYTQGIQAVEPTLCDSGRRE